MKRFLIISAAFFLMAVQVTAQPRLVNDLSGSGWKLWHDSQAKWQQEEIFNQPVDIAKLPTVPPTGGWSVLASPQMVDVKVPGTLEEYLQTVTGPEGDLNGVSWWVRPLEIPKYTGTKKVILKFGSIRSRAEVFVDRKLAGYWIVDNVPFGLDITKFVQPGRTAELAVRITDAGGNYDWRDGALIPWGDKTLPPGHAFGGITGRVYLEVCDPVYTSDIYVQNTPALTTVNTILTVDNTTGKAVKRDVKVSVYPAGNPSQVVFTNTLTYSLTPGENEITVPVSVPDAKLWDVENPNLYLCSVTLSDGSRVTDQSEKRFGFRWFEAVGIGEDAMFRLNGKRIMLRSAISWSFWPVNGIFPTDELARRQIEIAKELGLNMLNFHRFIGSPNVLDCADELGLLYFEEPGGYRTQANNPFLKENLRQKVMTMVKRDRSHPSLVIFNMMNESGAAQPDKLAVELADMREAHALDPSRYLLRTSAWAAGDYVDDQAKIHQRPYDTTMYWNGWYDYHHAGGPASWHEELYRGPDDYYNNTTNKKEIVFYGEEGAISSPLRLEKIMEEFLKASDDQKKLIPLGWDWGGYIGWYHDVRTFLNRKDLRGAYPTVDTLTVALGRVSFEHQGRKIESARLNNLTDAYVINGWETELIENFSGIVDPFRYPKSTPRIISQYNRPLYVAVKVRQQVAPTNSRFIADFYLINEENVHGTHHLVVAMLDHTGKETYKTSRTVEVAGGDVYGQLLWEGVELPTFGVGAMLGIEATLFNEKWEKVTTGKDQILAVNLESNKLTGHGAVWESGAGVRKFLLDRAEQPVAAYTDDLEKLDWVVVTTPPKKDQLSVIPAESLRAANGSNGLDATYYMDVDFKQQIYKEVAPIVNLSAIEGATPSPHVPTIAGYGIIWSGEVIPPVTGEYTFGITSNERSDIVLTVNGKELQKTDARRRMTGDGKITLTAGIAAKIEIRFRHARSNARCRLEWAVPNDRMPDPQKLMERAKRDGTTVIILEHADDWAEYIAANSEAKFQETFYVGTNWLGGAMFSKPHPIFKELPAGDALNWPYQALIHTGVERMGFVMEGEEVIVGAWHSYPMKIGTAVGGVKVGNGQVIFSTLDIYDNVVNGPVTGLVAKKMLLNMIESAGK